MHGAHRAYAPSAGTVNGESSRVFWQDGPMFRAVRKGLWACMSVIALISGSACGPSVLMSSDSSASSGGGAATTSTTTTSSTSSAEGGAGGGPGGCAWEGDFVVNSPSDTYALSGYCEITGNLSIATFNTYEISIPGLQSVHGDVVLEQDTNFDLKELDLPALTHVQSFRIWSGPKLATIHLDSLTTVEDEVQISQAENLAVVLPALQTVGGRIGLYYGVSALDAGVLESVGGTMDLDNLATLKAPKLATVGGALLLNATKIDALDLPALVTLGQTLGPSAIALDFDPDAQFGVCSDAHANALLAALDLPLLENLGPANTGAFNVGNNPLLPQCQIDALAEQLQKAGWSGGVQVSSTECVTAAGPCP